MNNEAGWTDREFRLQLFGGPRLQRGDTPVRISPQELSLVALVASAGRRGMGRDELLDYMWKSGSHITLRPRLAQVLHMARQKLGCPTAIVDAGRCLILSNEHFSTDLEEFENALSGGRFEEAISLLSLGFLSQLRGTETHAVAQWLEDRYVQLRAQVRRELSRALQEAQDQADFARLAELCSLQLKLDPEDEATLRRLMRAYGAQGRPDEARAELRRFTELVNNRNPDWRPSAETLTVMLAADSISKDSPWVKKYLRHHGHRYNPFHGREGHHSIITGLLRHDGPPTPTLIILTGEPGMGRSRTMHQALLDIASSGVTVLLANAGGSGIGQSLYPLSQAFAHHELAPILSHIPSRVTEILLATVLGHPRVTSPLSVSSDAPQTIPFSSVCEAVLQLIKAWSCSKRVVLALDDAHLADPDTITLLRYMLRRGLPDGFSLLLSVAGTDLYAPSIIDLADPCITATDTYILELDPLGAASLERIGGHILGHAFPAHLIAGLVALSKGSPKRMVLSSKVISDAISAGSGPKEALYAFIRSRYEQLSENARQLLALLAVADCSLTVEASGTLLSRSSEEISSMVDSCLSAWVRQENYTLSYIAPVCADAVRVMVPAIRRRTMHLEIGRYLEASGDYGRAHQIGRHLLEGGAGESAMAWIEKALGLSAQGYDAEPAVRLAAEAIRRSSDATGKSRLSLALGRHFLEKGDVAAAIGYFDNAQDLLLPEHLDSELLRKVEVALLEAKCLGKDRKKAPLLSDLRELRDRLHSEKRWALLARICHAQLRLLDSGEAPHGEAEIMNWLNDLLTSEAGALSEELIPLALVFSAQVRNGSSSQAVRVLSEVMSQLEQPRHGRLLAEALQLRLLVSYHQGLLNCSEGISLRRKAIAAVTQLQDPTLLCRHYLNTAAWYIDTLDLDNAPDSLGHALQFASAFCPPQLAREIAFNQGELLLLQGRPHEAYDIFIAGYHSSPSEDPDAGTILFGTGLAASLVKMKRPQEALPFLPSSSLLFARWAIDLSLLMKTHSQLITDATVQRAFIEECTTILSLLRDTSFLWYVRALLTISQLQRRHSLPVDDPLIREARAVCQAQSLPYLAGQLTNVLNSRSR